MNFKNHCIICGTTLNKENSIDAYPFKGQCCHKCHSEFISYVHVAHIENKPILFNAYENTVLIYDKSKKFELNELQNIVEGYIVPIKLSHKKVVIVNEEGRIRNLPINKNWSKFIYSDETVELVGNVLFLNQENLV